MRNDSCLGPGWTGPERDPEAREVWALGCEGPDLLFEVDRVVLRSGPGWRVLFARLLAEDWMRVARDGAGFGLGFPRMFGFSAMRYCLGSKVGLGCFLKLP